MTASPALLTKELESAMAKLRSIVVDRGSNHTWLILPEATALLQHIAALEQRVEAFAETNAAHVERLVSADKLLTDAATILDEFDSPLLVGSDWHRELRVYRAQPKEPR